MAEPKTRPTDASVADLLASVPQRREDAETVCELMSAATGEAPVVWGTSIVGFGSISSPTATGASTEWPAVAFAPRKREIVLYLNADIEPEQFEGLGPHRRGVGCVYIKRLSDLDQQVLVRLLARSVELARR